MASHEMKKRRSTGSAAVVAFILADLLFAAVLVLLLTGWLPKSGNTFFTHVFFTDPVSQNSLPGDDLSSPEVVTKTVQADHAVPDSEKTVNIFPEENSEGAFSPDPEEISVIPAQGASAFRVNGVVYSGNIYLRKGENLPRVSLSELASAVGSELKTDELSGICSFLFDGDRVKFTPYEENFSFGGIFCSLGAEALPVKDGTDLLVPANAVLTEMYPVVFDSSRTGIRSFSSAVPPICLPSEKKLTLLDFHHVTGASGRISSEDHWYSVSSEDFEEMLCYVTTEGISALTFENISTLRDANGAVMILFEGCYEDVYTSAFPLLKKYDMCATVFISPDEIGASGKMTESQLTEMVQSGLVSVQCSVTTQGVEQAGSIAAVVQASSAEVMELSGRVPFVCLCRDSSFVSAAMGQFSYCVRPDSMRPFDTSCDTCSSVYAFTVDSGMTAAELMRYIASSK